MTSALLKDAYWCDPDKRNSLNKVDKLDGDIQGLRFLQ
jgi:hypothetical protein